MKTKLNFLPVLLLGISLWGAPDLKSAGQAVEKEQVRVTVVPEIISAAQALADEFNQQSEFSEIQLIPEHKTHGETADGVSFRIISDAQMRQPDLNNHWRIVLGRDIVVAVINAQHPNIDQLLKKGIRLSQLKKVGSVPDFLEEVDLLGAGLDAPIPVYYGQERVVQSVLSDMSEGDGAISDDLLMSSEEVIDRLQQNKKAIGFCRFESCVDPVSQKFKSGIRLLPIDFNGNGRLDQVEDIGSDLQQFRRGVWLGKYPKALYQNIYAIAEVLPEENGAREFIQWIITGGQDMLAQEGYSVLVGSEIYSKLKKLSPVQSDSAVKKSTTLGFNIFLIVFSVFVIAIMLFVLNRNIPRRKLLMNSQGRNSLRGIHQNDVSFPEGLYYDKSHTWAFMEKNGLVRVGVDGFLQHLTGEISRVLLKDQNENIQKGDSVLTLIQKGKQLNIKAPVSGIIRSINHDLVLHSALLNEEPYEGGWVYLIEPTNWNREMSFLSRAESYRTWIKKEFTRLKDFVVEAMAKNNLEPSAVILQDGGELAENVLAEFGPEIWEDFQLRFLEQNL